MDFEVDVFDEKSVAKALELLKDFDGHSAIDETMLKVAERAVEIVKEEIIASGAVGFTGDLLDSVTYEYDKKSKTITILIMAEYAIYVEFGTGVVGQSSPHPKAQEEGYTYNVKQRQPGEKWSYWKDGNWYSTEGQEPKMFLLRAEERIKQYLATLNV